MGLKVILQKDKVRIPKLHEEFTLVLPPEEISKPALQVLAYLKNSPYLQIRISSHHKSEIFEILQKYGQALFKAIIPVAYQAYLQNPANAGRQIDIYIDFLPWSKIMWELLYNGINWHSLDAGVKRIYTGKARIRHYASDSKKCWHFINHPIIYQGSQTQPTLEFLQTPIEWFQKEHKNLLHRCSWKIDLQSKEQDLKESLAKTPRYLYLEGFYDLEKLCVSSANQELVNKSLTEVGFEQVIAQGLELVLCNLKQIRISASHTNYNLLFHRLFELGLPRLIDFAGSMHKRIMAIYMTRLVLLVAQEKQIYQAHMQAINNIAKTGSWDWIWVRYWENDKKLAAIQTAYNKDDSRYINNNELFFAAQASWDLRLFRGDVLQLESLAQQILTLPRTQSLLILDEYFQNARSYLNQIAIKHYKNICVINIVLTTTNFLSKQHSFTSFSADIQTYLRQNNKKDGIYLQQYDLTLPKNSKKKIIQVFLPFSQQNIATQIKEFKSRFLAAIANLQEEFTNYAFVFVCHHNENKEQAFVLHNITFAHCIKFFDSASQETMQKNFAKIIEKKNVDFSYRLFKILFLLKIKNFSQDNIWELVFLNLKKQLSLNQKRILGICFCLCVSIPIAFLRDLFQTKKILSDIEQLYSYNLIEKNATHTVIYLESGMQHLLASREFFTKQDLQWYQFFMLYFFSRTQATSYRKLFAAFVYFHFADCIALEKGKYIEGIYRCASSWQEKQLVYTKIFEQLYRLPEKTMLYWISVFYTDILIISGDVNWVKKIQELNDLLEEREDWNLFCKNHITLCKFFLQQDNHQRVRNLLAPVIELSKNGIFASEQIMQIAFLLIELGDDNIYLALLDYFPIDLQLSRENNVADKTILKAYQFFLQGEKQIFFDLLCREINNSKKLNVALYSKVYLLYVNFCAVQKKFQNLKIFVLKFREALDKSAPYNHYQIIISALFDAIKTNRQGSTDELFRNFFVLLEIFYKFAKLNNDKKFYDYADILGKFYHDIGDKQREQMYYGAYYHRDVK